MTTFIQRTRCAIMAIVTGSAVTIGVLSAPIVFGALTPVAAQISEDAQIALEQYGSWRPHPRFGEVWVPNGVPADWRPYEYGHWVYTDEWGWYWVSDDVEADWGWVVFHYGRWAFERGTGWYWIPGDEWGPAWVNWRYGDEYAGWAPLPPDELIETYEAEPAYWVFVPTRFVAAPRLQTYFVPVYRRSVILRQTNIVNRTVPVHGRLGVNPGISPAFVARMNGAPIATYRVRPRVFASTQGVAGAVQVRREELRSGPGGPRGPGGPAFRPGAGAARPGAISVQRTTTVIQPGAAATAPQPLGKDERGRLGTNPPRAAQGVAPSTAPPQSSPTQPSLAPSPPPAIQRQTPAVQQQAPAGSPPPPKPPGPPASTTAPANTAPLQREEHRERVAPGGPPSGPLPQPNIVRPIPPQAPPPSPPLQHQQVQPPPPPAPPPQRQVQPPSPPPPQQRQVQPPPGAHPPPPPPPAARAPAPPPKKPPPKPGEKPEEKK